MGNDNSILEECKVENEHVAVGDWRLHDGVWRAGAEGPVTKISVFEKVLTSDSSKREIGIHENAAKALKIYRHPFIVKYLDTGTKINSIYVMTERVEPLSKVIHWLPPLEICAGLHCVMQALAFCHDTCKVRHNNLGMDSIYVASDGTWKLAGMEFLSKQSDYNEEFLQKTRAFRNEEAIPPEEKEGSFGHLNSHGHAGDVFALGLLVKEVLEILLKIAEFPQAKPFLDRIKKDVLAADHNRPQVTKLLDDQFFQHDFIEIYTFLRNLAVKQEDEKESFFRTLASRLYLLPELAAARLSNLLLSRFVLLNAAANLHFLPHLLRPCTEVSRPSTFMDTQTNPIFTVPFFKKHIIPLLVDIFDVLDFNIRTALLTHFKHYVHLFDEDTLARKILPQILLGIKDINDTLVSASLHALAFTVLVLGGEAVIGKKRCQHFSGSRPKEITTSVQCRNPEMPTCLSHVVDSASSPLRQLSEVANIEQVPLSPKAIKGNNNPLKEMPTDHLAFIPEDDSLSRYPDALQPPAELERSSPDGSESGERETGGVDAGADEWSDWEDLPLHKEKPTPPDDGTLDTVQLQPNDGRVTALRAAPTARASPEVGLGQEFDIMALEIGPWSGTSGGETDFFVDMQPVIVPAAVLAQSVAELLDGNVSKQDSGRLFAMEDTSEDATVGWGNDLDWSSEL